MWRAADEALLERLSDEVLLERVWALAAPGAEPLHPRASGMIRLLRARPGAVEAIESAERGDAGALLALITPAPLAGWGPELTHHVALFQRARAQHAIVRDVGRGASREVLSLVIATWLALANQGTYLRELARDVIGGSLPEADVERAVREAAWRGIDAVAEMARSGVEGRQPVRALALQALVRIDDAIGVASIEGELAIAARARASAVIDAIVSELMAPLALEVEELAAREWKPNEVAAMLERARDAWRWAGEEVEVERFVVRELPRFAWDLYRDKRWDELRALLRPIEGPCDRLARRVESDPRHVAWAAQCAQVLVFRAELAATLEAQISLAERAHRLAPTLRNARLVLADLLCARAERRLDQPIVLRHGEAWTAASADAERAGEIFPELTRLAGLRERLGTRGAG